MADDRWLDRRIVFRPATPEDLPMLAEWLRTPHLREWWGEPEPAMAEMREAMDDPATEPSIAELDGTPVAYLQSYDPHLEKGHPYRDQPEGTLGIDISIGPAELLDRGLGSALVLRYAAFLFGRGARRLIIDPDPANARAVRAYEKAGFRAFDRRETEYGPALMMALNAEGKDAA